MATSPLNPMLQAVLLHQHHQTTTPYAPSSAPVVVQQPAHVPDLENVIQATVPVVAAPAPTEIIVEGSNAVSP